MHLRSFVELKILPVEDADKYNCFQFHKFILEVHLFLWQIWRCSTLLIPGTSMGPSIRISCGLLTPTILSRCLFMDSLNVGFHWQLFEQKKKKTDFKSIHLHLFYAHQIQSNEVQ